MSHVLNAEKFEHKEAEKNKLINYNVKNSRKKHYFKLLVIKRRYGYRLWHNFLNTIIVRTHVHELHWFFASYI